MAGKKFFNNQNIYVETDYQNIVVVDPNKVVNVDGTVEERLVNHEELVMYANLEAKIIPRTKLAVGNNYDDSIQNIRIGELDGEPDGTVNFMKPRGKNILDDSWTNQLTGDGALEGNGVNQTKVTWQEKEIRTGDGKTETNFVQKRDTLNQEDTQMLGITSINIRLNTSYVPVVTIQMEDIQGRILFEQGENSPYSAFMQFPYPLFTLTLKGYFGKAVRYELMLKDFNATFDTSTGNYKITTNYIARTYALLSDIQVSSIIALPKMYINETTFSGTQTITPTTNNATGENNRLVETKTVKSSRGYEKMKEVYSEYKAKGLIDDDFPELTVEQMIMKLDNFENYVIESYGQEDMSVLFDIKDYKNTITEFRNELYGVIKGNWYSKYVDTSKRYVLNNQGKSVLNRFKGELSRQEKLDGLSELDSIFEKYNTKLNENKTFGSEGFCTIGGEKITDTAINVDFNRSFLIRKLPNLDDINFEETYTKTFGVTPNEEELVEFRTKEIGIYEQLDPFLVDVSTLQVEEDELSFIFFEYGLKLGKPPYDERTFLGKLSKIEEQFNQKRNMVEEKISEELSKKIKSPDIGLGFNPTIKNVLAVICASADGFMRLMDDVHDDAWDVRDNPVRLTSIVDSQKAFNIESKEAVESVTVDGKLTNTTIVYPWPHYMELQKDEEGNEEYVAMYPGDSTVASKTQAYDNTIWPEIKFVEEYLKATTLREGGGLDLSYPNEGNTVSLYTPSAIEFPMENIPYTNRSEVSYLYEVLERIMINSRYNNFIKTENNQNQLYEILGEIEFTNIKLTLSDSPELVKKLKEIPFTYDNYLQFLETATKSGSWNLYKRDEYVTNYIRGLIDKDFGIYDYDYLFSSSSDVLNGQEVVDKLVKHLNSSETNTSSFLDTYPFNYVNWSKENLSEGVKISNKDDVYKNVIKYNVLSTKKVISTFKIGDDNITDKKYFTNFYWRNNNSDSPNQIQQNITDNTQDVTEINNHQIARNFYNQRRVEDLFLTESFLNYNNSYDPTKNNLTNIQTTSLLNTPYFVNAILKGVENKKNNLENPYVSLGYLYLNSLPLSTSREKIKSFVSGITKENGYIYSALNKYSAIHTQPYYWVLKYGSIWHRYKKYYNDNIDILDDIWKDFDYVKNYDPLTEDITKNYIIKTEGNEINFKHKEISLNDISTINDDGTFDIINSEVVIINAGLYPKVINDIYYYFTNKNIFENYNSEEFIDAHDNKKLTLSKNSNGSIFKSIGYDPNIYNRMYSLDTWCGYFDIKDNTDFEDYNSDNILIVPSYGYSKFNQTKFECFRELDGKATQDVIDNPSIFNGMVRTLWESPNYGYFNNNMIKKPNPDEYIKQIDKNTSNEQPFDLNNNEYSSIEEIFGLFKKEILDEFESHFLNFCKEPENVNPSLLTINQGDFDDFLNKKKQELGYSQDEELPDDELYRLRSLFNNNGNIFKSDEKTVYYNITLHDVMKKLFIIPKPNFVDDTEENIKNISKKQSKKFLESHKKAYLNEICVLKIGNSGKYNRKVFDSFSKNTDLNPLDKLDFGKYEPNSLPASDNTITLEESINNNQSAWKAMYLYVGTSTIEQLKYKDNGSYLTDFFILFNVKFDEANIKNLSQIIKIFATKKLNNEEYDVNDFYDDLNIYQLNYLDLQRNTSNDIFLKLNRQLPSVRTTQDNTLISSVDGDVAKIDAWETFRLMNDKWVAGQDFKTRTIFEDFLFLDRANRPVGDKVVVNIENLRTYLKGRDSSMTVYDLVGFLLEDSNFTFMPTPVYTNFYGRNDRVKEGQEVPQDIPNDMFGTFMEVDTKDSRPRMLAIYIGKPSEQLDDSNYPNSRRLDDSFDLTRVSDCPLIESQINKTNYSESNKCVGFNVDFGTRNQGIFKGISLDMKQTKNIAPTFQVVEDLGSMTSQQKVAQQSQSLYNFYKSKSYTCQVQSMGNAMIQPTMYFNLRHVPMFTGPYLIINVDHNITPNNFETNFTGIRIPKYSLQVPDKLVMSVNKEILKTFQEKFNQQQNEKNQNTTNITSSDDSYKQETNKPVDESSCQENNQYTDKQFVTQVEIRITKSQITSVLNSFDTVNSNIKKYLYGLAIIENYDTNDNVKCLNNNIYNIKTNTTNSIGNKKRFFTSQICVENSDLGTIPMASFSNINNSIEYMIDFYRAHNQTLTELIEKLGQDKEAEACAHLWAATWINKVEANSAQGIIDNIGSFKNTNNYKTVVRIFERAFKIY